MLAISVKAHLLMVQYKKVWSLAVSQKQQRMVYYNTPKSEINQDKHQDKAIAFSIYRRYGGRDDKKEKNLPGLDRKSD